MEPLAPNIFLIKPPDKKNYAIIHTTTVPVTNGIDIKKQEWVVMDCAMEIGLIDNYINKSRLKLSEKVLFHKQGNALYTIIHGRLGSNVIAAAKNSTNIDYNQTHKDRCVISLLKIHLSVYIKNISGTKMDSLYDAL